ncbi:MAG: hypothetical protein PUG02_10425 [Selenomonadaceae bacterium]|nr:hypothetical protein [Selenomonadaceae bacterium]
MDNIIIYNTDDGAASVKLYANDGTVWLARAEIASLFQKDRSTISKHIKNIFAEGELDEKNNVHFLHIDNSKKPVALYSLDVILAVGFRVRSPYWNNTLYFARLTNLDDLPIIIIGVLVPLVGYEDGRWSVYVSCAQNER